MYFTVSEGKAPVLLPLFCTSSVLVPPTGHRTPGVTGHSPGVVVGVGNEITGVGVDEKSLQSTPEPADKLHLSLGSDPCDSIASLCVAGRLGPSYGRPLMKDLVTHWKARPSDGNPYSILEDRPSSSRNDVEDWLMNYTRVPARLP